MAASTALPPDAIRIRTYNAVMLSVFDIELSQASWYRDYAAYCGASDDGARVYLMIWQLGRKKPVLRKEFAGPMCETPKWDRNPSRVTFVAGGEKASFIVRAGSA